METYTVEMKFDGSSEVSFTTEVTEVNMRNVVRKAIFALRELHGAHVRVTGLNIQLKV